MKIEKMNEHQIRCTLTKEDLRTRQIDLRELAYGSDKMRQLFWDMMQQAADDLGFVVGDSPLMIEAVPLVSESVVLIISKVDSPDELDMRFSNFTAAQGSPQAEKAVGEEPDSRQDIEQMVGHLFERMREQAKNESEQKNQEKARAYTFENLDTVISLSRALNGSYQGKNDLFKDRGKGIYHLIMRQSGMAEAEFNRISSVAAEYGQPERYTPGSEAYFREHLTLIRAESALQVLMEL